VTPDAVAAATARIANGKETDRSVSVRCVSLFSSTLEPGGPTYERLGTAPLGASSAWRPQV
jgi:2'-5' RNA ligase